MLTETLHSKILGTAREKGLVYSMSSGSGQTKKTSNWWFGAQIMPQNAHDLFTIIRNELQSVFAGKISDDDIQSAKQYALGRYQRSGQTVGGTAYGYAGWYFFDETIDDYYRLPERITNVTQRQIIDISTALFRERLWGLGVLGSCGQDFVNDMNEQLRNLWD